MRPFLRSHRHDLAERAWVGAPVEYWFFRTSWASGALLADVIYRRTAGVIELRVASWHDGKPSARRIRRESPGTQELDPGRVVDCDLTLQTSRGSCGPISWDLKFDVARATVSAPPAPWRQLGTFDLSLTSWPRAKATGDVTIDGRTDVLLDRPSMLCHYWGRQLPRRWLWLSANDFDRPDIAVEASLLNSQAWGRRVPLPTLGYAWLQDRAATHLVASPISGLVRYAPRPAGGVNIFVAGLRGRWQLQAWAPGGSFVDLGERIAQSLRADCRLLVPSGEALAQGVATLEVRDEEWLTSGVPGMDPAQLFAANRSHINPG
jgi:hypothetical protein